MSPFWSTLLDELRGRGRNGTLFLTAILLLVAAALVAAAIPSDLLNGYILPVMAVGVTIVMATAGVTFWRTIKRKHPRGSVGELSCDELNKARSKLVKGQFRRPL